MKRVLSLCICVAVASSAALPCDSAGFALTQKVNAFRIDQGLPALKISPSLSKVAEMKHQGGHQVRETLPCSMCIVELVMQNAQVVHRSQSEQGIEIKIFLLLHAECKFAQLC